MIRKTIMCTILVFNHLLCFAQSDVDASKLSPIEKKNDLPNVDQMDISAEAKIDTLFSLAEQYKDSRPQLSDSLYKTIIDLSTSVNLSLPIAKALTGLGVIYAYRNDYSASDSLFHQAFKYLEGREDSKSRLARGNALKHKARSFFFRYQLDSALLYFIEAEKIFRQGQNTKELIPILNALGILYGEIGQELDKAIEYFDESIVLNYQIGDSLQAAKGIQNVAQVYALTGEYQRSNELLLQSNTEVERRGDIRSLAVGYNTLATNYKAMQLLDSSAGYFRKSIAINKEINDAFGLSEDLVGYAQVLKDMGQYQSSVAAAMEALELTQNNKARLRAYQLISTSYESLGDYQLSLDYMKHANKVNDSIYNKTSQETIAELQTKYETEKKEQEIAMLSQENDLAETRQRLFVIATMLLIVITSLILFQYIQRNKHAKVVEEKNKQLSETMAAKEKLFSVIAHDLKSPLSALTAMSSTLADNIDMFQKEQIATYLRKFEKGSQNLAELLNNLLEWSLSQTGAISVNVESLDISEAIANAVKPLKDLAESKEIDLHLHAAPLAVAGDPKMVETVIRNLVSNALKFTDRGGSVSLTTQQENGQVRIAVLDTGVGMAEEEVARLFDITEDPMKIGDHKEKGTGLGLILSKELIEKNQGTIGATSAPGKGSTFYFTLPSAA
ncbi:MAG: tetratricopeptide repeat-containing sensor histidine kinase [Bacteroidota bacterium]